MLFRSSIRARRVDSQITDKTFAGVGIVCTENVDSVKQGFSRWLGIKCDTSNGLSKAVLIRSQGLSQVTSIDLHDCQGISDVGVSAIAQGCPLLTSIYLGGCHHISDIGVSAMSIEDNTVLLLIHLRLIYSDNCKD